MKKAFLKLHTAVLLAGFTGVLGRLITLNEVSLVWCRLLISAITLWCIMLLAKQIQKVSFQQMKTLAAIGVLSAIHWVFFYASIKYANISVGVVCLSATGFFSSLLEPLLTNKKFQWTEVLFGLLTIFGIYLIFHFDTRYKTGITLGIIAAFFSAMFPVFQKKIITTVNMPTVLTWQMTTGFLTLSLILPFYLKWFPTPTIIPSYNDFIWLLVLSWLCTIVAFLLSLSALKKLNTFTVNLSYCMEPLYGILMAFIFYKENKMLNASFYIGLAIILLTLTAHMYLLWKEKKQQQTVTA